MSLSDNVDDAFFSGPAVPRRRLLPAWLRLAASARSSRRRPRRAPPPARLLRTTRQHPRSRISYPITSGAHICRDDAAAALERHRHRIGRYPNDTCELPHKRGQRHRDRVDAQPSPSATSADVFIRHRWSITRRSPPPAARRSSRQCARQISGTVATFSDPQTAELPGNSLATINWGDGTSTRERSPAATAVSRSPGTTPTAPAARSPSASRSRQVGTRQQCDRGQ